MSVKVGLTLPSFVDDPEIPIAVARAAEAAELDAVFVYDHLWRGDPPNRRPALECFTLLGAVAAETTTIGVGTLVARATLRPAATLANAFTTAQKVSDGRLYAAIGSGDSQSRAENEAFGLDFGTMAERVAALHDAVRASRADTAFPCGSAGAPRRCARSSRLPTVGTHGASTPTRSRARLPWCARLRRAPPSPGVGWPGRSTKARRDWRNACCPTSMRAPSGSSSGRSSRAILTTHRCWASCRALL